MRDPPVFDGAVQLNVTQDEEVFASSRIKEVGADGTLGIMAPFPAVEADELPMEFVATIFANTELA